jgi:hypothetical protein
MTDSNSFTWNTVLWKRRHYWCLLSTKLHHWLLHIFIGSKHFLPELVKWNKENKHLKQKEKVGLIARHESTNRGSRGVCFLSLTSALYGRWVVKTRPRPLYPQKWPGVHCRGGCLGPGPVWTYRENLAPHRYSIPGRPACSESLCQLSYSGPSRHHKHFGI